MSSNLAPILLLRKTMTFLVIVLSLLVLVAAYEFTTDIGISKTVKQWIALIVASIVLTGFHFWVANLKLGNVGLLAKFIWLLLAAEYLFTLLFLMLIVFSFGKLTHNIVLLCALQVTHLAIYSLNWFFFDERNVLYHKTLSVEKIAEIGEESTISLAPKYQSNNLENE